MKNTFDIKGKKPFKIVCLRMLPNRNSTVLTGSSCEVFVFLNNGVLSFRQWGSFVLVLVPRVVHNTGCLKLFVKVICFSN